MTRPPLSRKVPKPPTRIPHCTIYDREHRNRLALATALGLSIDDLKQLGAEDEARRYGQERQAA